MKARIQFGIMTAAWLVSSQFAAAALPTPDEMAEARRWAAAKFEGVVEKPRLEAGLQVVANLNAVQMNLRNGKPLQIGDRQYTRGLYCHATSKVVARLPGAGKTFTAVVGVDSNDQTAPAEGRSSSPSPLATRRRSSRR